jgi:hypothetical protein
MTPTTTTPTPSPSPAFTTELRQLWKSATGHDFFSSTAEELFTTYVSDIPERMAYIRYLLEGSKHFDFLDERERTLFVARSIAIRRNLGPAPALAHEVTA